MGASSTELPNHTAKPCPLSTLKQWSLLVLVVTSDDVIKDNNLPAPISHSLFLSVVAELMKTARQLGSRVWIYPDQGTWPWGSEVTFEHTEVTGCLCSLRYLLRAAHKASPSCETLLDVRSVAEQSSFILKPAQQCYLLFPYWPKVCQEIKDLCSVSTSSWTEENPHPPPS